MIIHYKPKKHQGLTWQLGRETLERVTTYKYLGVDLCQCVGPGSNALPFKLHHERVISKALTRMHMVKHLGMCKDGLKLTTATKLYKLLVRPVMEYAAPILSYTKSQLQKYEQCQLKCLKSLIGLQKHGTLGAAVRLLAGIEPMKSRFDFLKLNYFQKIRLMEQNRLVQRVFKLRFGRAPTGLTNEALEIMTEQDILHEFKHTSTQEQGLFSRFIKNTILMNSYKRDNTALSQSTSGKLFFQLHFPTESYLKAKPQTFRARINTPFLKDYGKAIEERKSRTGFLQALLGRHPLHFMMHKNSKCPHCGTEFKDILEHALFDCPYTQSERTTWISHLENDMDTDNSMNAILLTILKESTKPVEERMCKTNTIKLVAFGGHTALKRNGDFVVTRKDFKRLDVSDILSQRTAELLNDVYSKFSE